MASDYAVAQNVADHLLDTSMIDGGIKEGILDSLVIRASRLIDAWYGKPEGYWKSGATASVRYYDGNGRDELWPEEMAAAPTEVAVAEDGILTTYTVWAATDYLLYPLNALAEGRPYRSLKIDPMNGTKLYFFKYPKSVKITCRWGYATEAPETITEACVVQSARWYKRGQQGFQDAGAVTELMQLRYLKKLDPEVELLLGKMPGGVTI